ncbi:MAG: autotransporter domain-containing protein [Roseibium sp.]|nr:autotransporter domain-containing protein [Roseibium sp.]
MAVPGHAHAFDSCNGFTAFLQSDGSSNSVRTTQFNLTHGDVISGTVSGVPDGLTARVWVATTGRDPQNFFISAPGGTYTFTANLASREDALGQQEARVGLQGASTSIGATVSCVGTSTPDPEPEPEPEPDPDPGEQPDPEPDPEEDPDTPPDPEDTPDDPGGDEPPSEDTPATGTPTQQTSQEETEGVVQGRFGISGSDDWLPPTGEGSEWDEFSEDNPELWTWNQITGRFNNRNIGPEVTRLMARQEQLSQEQTQLQSESAQNDREKTELSRNLLNTRTRISELEDQLGELLFQHDHLKNSPIPNDPYVQEDFGKVSGQIAAVQNRLNQLRQTRNEQQARLEQLERERYKLDDDLAGVNRAFESVKAQLGRLLSLAGDTSPTGYYETGASSGGSAYGASGPFGLFNLSENSISFSASLRAWRERRKSKARSASSRIENAFFEAGRPRYADPGLPGLLGDRRFNAWIDGSYTWTDDDRTGAEAKSEAGILRAGLHYTLLPRVGVGAIVRYAFSESTRSDRSVVTDGDGFGASVYSQFRLPHGAVLSPVFAYERTDTDIAIAGGGTTVTGNFDTDIFTFGGTLNRRFQIDTGMENTVFFVDPNLTLSYITAKRRRYVRNDGVVIPGDTTNQGTFVFGPTVGLQIRNVSDSIALIQPTLGVSGNWNFVRPDSFLSTSNTVVSTPTAFGSLMGGLSVALTNGLNGQINGSYSGFGSDVTSTSIFGRLSMPF